MSARRGGTEGVPDGWEALEDFSQPFEQFLLWTELDSMGPAWHRFVVVKQLNRRGKDPYTHDAHVYGDSAKHKRGVRLSMAAHEAGCWIGIAPASTAWSMERHAST